MVELCRTTDLAELSRIYDRIRMVTDLVKPTPEQIAECEPYTDLDVAGRSETDWYCLLYKAQNHPEAYKNGCHYMLHWAWFIRYSRWCEYGYIINLDSGVLEFWIGGQTQPQPGNRYGFGWDDGYYPCRLALTFPLDAIPDDAVAQMKAEPTKETITR
jgi:hypothetical protein